MILIWSTLTIPKHIIHLFPFFISLQRDDHSCWNFGIDFDKSIWFGAFQIAYGLFGHLLFGFRFPGEIFVFPDLRVDQWFPRSWIMIPICWMLFFGIMMDFFKQPLASVQIEAVFIFELFKFFLITSADSVYFCAFVLFWLEIRLITIFPICFW